MEVNEEIDMAFRNSYEVIINGKDASLLIKGNVGYFIHHPSKPISKDLLKT